MVKEPLTQFSTHILIELKHLHVFNMCSYSSGTWALMPEGAQTPVGHWRPPLQIGAQVFQVMSLPIAAVFRKPTLPQGLNGAIQHSEYDVSYTGHLHDPYPRNGKCTQADG